MGLISVDAHIFLYTTLVELVFFQPFLKDVQEENHLISLKTSVTAM